jgi:hypothetical protein
MDFDFGTSPNENEGNNNDQFGTAQQPSEPKPESNNNDFLDMDFKSPPEQSQQKSTLDDMLNMNFQSPPEQPQSQPTNDMKLNMDFNMNNNTGNLGFDSSKPVDEEEQKRLEDRRKEAEQRMEKINEKKKKEEELRSQIIKKASEYMAEFEAKRQEDIAKRRKELEEKNSETNMNKGGDNNSDSWGRVNSNIDLKDSDYKGSKDVQRMREAMLNKTNGPNTELLSPPLFIFVLFIISEEASSVLQSLLGMCVSVWGL